MFNPNSFRHPQTQARRFALPEIAGFEQGELDQAAFDKEPDESDLAPYQRIAATWEA